MLFDLRGRGRRRTVQTIYVALAIIMGGGLVFFGIGGGTSGGGLLDAFKGGGGGGGSDTFTRQINAAEKTLKTSPNDAAAWALIARARFQQAGQCLGVVREVGVHLDEDLVAPLQPPAEARHVGVTEALLALTGEQVHPVVAGRDPQQSHVPSYFSWTSPS